VDNKCPINDKEFSSVEQNYDYSSLKFLWKVENIFSSLTSNEYIWIFLFHWLSRLHTAWFPGSPHVVPGLSLLGCKWGCTEICSYFYCKLCGFRSVCTSLVFTDRKLRIALALRPPRSVSAWKSNRLSDSVRLKLNLSLRRDSRKDAPAYHRQPLLLQCCLRPDGLPSAFGQMKQNSRLPTDCLLHLNLSLELKLNCLSRSYKNPPPNPLLPYRRAIGPRALIGTLLALGIRIVA